MLLLRHSLLPPPPRPMLEGDAMLEELVEAVAAPPKRERPDHDWIRGGTWKMVDQRAALRKAGRLSQAEGRRLTRRIHKAFSDDRKERALQARTSGYLLYPIVARCSGPYFIIVCRSLDTLAIVKYVEIGTVSSKILQRT